MDSGPDQEDPLMSQITLQPFESVVEDAFHYEIDEHDTNILTFISGYVSYSVSNRLKCEMCNNRLFLDKRLLF